MHVQTAQAAPVSRFEPSGIEIRSAMNQEPATPQEWTRLAQLLKAARAEDFPEMDSGLFAEFRRDVIRYAGGRDVWPWLIVGLAVAIISWLVAPSVVGPELNVPVGVLMTIVAIAIPFRAAIAHRDLRIQTIAIGWSIGFFKLP